MKRAMVSLLLLFFFLTLPGYAAQAPRDYLIRGMPEYKLDKQRRNFEKLEIVDTTYEGNRVYSEYRYTGKTVERPSNLQIIRYYESAVDKLGGEILKGSDSAFDASFIRNGKQFYMKVRAGDSGNWCEVYILEVAGPPLEAEIIDDTNAFENSKVVIEVEILED